MKIVIRTIFTLGPSKDLFCSVSLPSVAPLAKTDTPCAQRCFIVCVPKVNYTSHCISELATLYEIFPPIGFAVKDVNEHILPFW